MQAGGLLRWLPGALIVVLVATLLPTTEASAQTGSLPTGGNVFPSSCAGDYWQTRFAMNQAVCVSGRVGPNPASGFLLGDSTIHVVPTSSGADPAAAVASRRIVAYGTFLDEPVWLPTLTPGSYHLVVDELSTGTFDPGHGDYVYFDVLEVANAVLDGYDFDVAAVKAQAQADYERYSDLADRHRRALLATGLAVSMFTIGWNYHLWVMGAGPAYGLSTFLGIAGLGAFGTRASDALPDVHFYPNYNAGVMAIGARIINQAFDAKAASYEHLARDPADPDYEHLTGPDLLLVRSELTEALAGDPLLAAFGLDAPELPLVAGSDHPLAADIADLANELIDQAALVEAIMRSNERFRGARDARDLPWTVAHGEALVGHAEALAASYELTRGLLGAIADGIAAAGEPDPVSGDDLAEVQDAIAGGFDAEARRNLRRGGFRETDIAELHASIMEIDPADLGDGMTLSSELRDWATTLEASEDAATGLADGVRDVLAALRADLGDPGVPSVGLVLPGQVDAGETFTASADVSGGEGTVTLAWDLTGDGLFEDATGSSVAVSFDRPGPQGVAVRATDARGVPAMDRATVDVAHEPVSTLAGSPAQSPLTAQPGASLTFSVEEVAGGEVSWLVGGEPAGSAATLDVEVPRRPGDLLVEARATDGGELVAVRHWVVLIDDDLDGADALAVEGGAPSLAAGDGLGSVDVALVDAGGSPVARDGEPVAVELVREGGAALPPGAGLAGTTTASTDAAGVATFDELAVTPITPSGTYRLRATHAEGRVAAGTSDAFSVTPPTQDVTNASVELEGLDGRHAPGTALSGTLHLALHDADALPDGDLLVELDLRDPSLGPLVDPATSVRDDVLAAFAAEPDVVNRPVGAAEIDGVAVAVTAEIDAASDDADLAWVAIVRDGDGRILGAQAAGLAVREPMAGDPGAGVGVSGLPDHLPQGETVTFLLHFELEDPDLADGDVLVGLDGPSALGHDGDPAAAFGSPRYSPAGIVGEPTPPETFGDGGVTVAVEIDVAAGATPGDYLWTATLGDDRGLLASYQFARSVPVPPRQAPEASADLTPAGAVEQGGATGFSLSVGLDDPDEVVHEPVTVALDLRDATGGSLLDPSTSVLDVVVEELAAAPDVLAGPQPAADVRAGLAASVTATIAEDAPPGEYVWVLEVRTAGGQLVAAAASSQSVGLAAAPTVTFTVSGNEEEVAPTGSAELVIEIRADDPERRLADELHLSWDLRTDADDPATSVRDAVFETVTTSPAGFFDEPAWTERVRLDGRRVSLSGLVAFDSPISDMDGFPLVLEARDAGGEVIARNTAESLLIGDDVRLRGTGGPVILTGIDPELGPNDCYHGCLSTWQGVLAGIFARTRTTGSGIVVIGANGSMPIQWWTNIVNGNPGLGLPGLGVPLDFVTSTTGIAELDFSQYAVIGVVTSQGQVSGGLTSAQSAALNARANDIATFVNRGGGVFGHTQWGLSNPYAYISGIGTITQSTSASDILTITEAGYEAGILEDFEGCCWHTSFSSWPDFMEPLVYGAGGRVQVLGGRQVGIATGITLDPPRSAARAGETVEIVAQVMEGEEAVGDAEVTFTFQDGSTHEGTVMSAVTGSDGRATMVMEGFGIGTDTVEASYVDSHGDERVSNVATIRWYPLVSDVTFTPEQAVRTVDQSHEVQASVTEDGQPAAGRMVEFTVTGAHADDVATATVHTGPDGVATFSYEGSRPGEDVVEVRAVDVMGRVWEAQLEVTWHEIVEQCVDLVAGQHMPAGEVCAIHDEETMTVTYSTADGWVLTETHLAVGLTIEQYADEQWLNRTDNPRPGHFPHKAVHDSVDTYTYTIPLGSLGEFDTVPELVVAAHAVVSGASGQETAWGDGTRFTEQGNWAMWFGYGLP